MQISYFLCDVFTSTLFGGNPLAVVPDARGLDAGLMQKIAREFNFSESTFVLPPEAGGDRRVRIFTPTAEIPFAGHPNVGTAFALASDGAFGDIGTGIRVEFEELAGRVPVSIRRDGAGSIWCELEAPQPLTLGEPVDASRIAAILGLAPADIATATHAPQVASVGLPFLMVEVRSSDALRRARIADSTALEQLRDADIVPHLHVYFRSNDDFDVRCRMFAPLDGVPEDPATGSANCALAAMLAHYDTTGAKEFSWRIAQGVEMGRPSVLDARCRKDNDAITTWIGGHSVLVGAGHLCVD